MDRLNGGTMLTNQTIEGEHYIVHRTVCHRLFLLDRVLYVACLFDDGV